MSITMSLSPEVQDRVVATFNTLLNIWESEILQAEAGGPSPAVFNPSGREMLWNFFRSNCERQPIVQTWNRYVRLEAQYERLNKTNMEHSNALKAESQTIAHAADNATASSTPTTEPSKAPEAESQMIAHAANTAAASSTPSKAPDAESQTIAHAADTAAASSTPTATATAPGEDVAGQAVAVLAALAETWAENADPTDTVSPKPSSLAEWSLQLFEKNRKAAYAHAGKSTPTNNQQHCSRCRQSGYHKSAETPWM